MPGSFSFGEAQLIVRVMAITVKMSANLVIDAVGMRFIVCPRVVVIVVVCGTMKKREPVGSRFRSPDS